MLWHSKVNMAFSALEAADRKTKVEGRLLEEMGRVLQVLRPQLSLKTPTISIFHAA